MGEGLLAPPAPGRVLGLGPSELERLPSCGAWEGGCRGLGGASVLGSAQP